jgi:phosphatidate cytidylyltransferase
MFKTRLLSGIVLVAILLATGILGGNILWGFCFEISMIGLYEFYRVFKIEKSLGIIGYGFAIVYYLSLLFYNGSVNGALFMAIELMVASGVYVLKYPKYSTEQVFVSILGLLYLPMMLSYIYQIRIAEDGLFSLWLIFISSWGCDTCAYCVGMLFGKRKLAPVLSPKKSIEGAVGGAIGAAILGAIYGAVVNNYMVMKNAPLHFAIICVVAAVISQFGDLIASGIKRQHGIKDYGKLIPGHGGILDRFDSVIFTAPVIYALLFVLA